MARGFQLPCECGCGELTFGEYKRGHRRNPPGKVTEPPEGEANGEGWRSISLDDAKDMTPDDPEPSGIDAPKYSPPPLRITKKVREDVEGKLAFIFAMTGTMASVADPVCGGAFVDNADNVAKKMAPIICKSPDMVAKITKSGDMMLYVDLLWACWPILITIAGHHLPKGRKAPEVDPTMPPQGGDNYVYSSA